MKTIKIIAIILLLAIWAHLFDYNKFLGLMFAAIIIGSYLIFKVKQKEANKSFTPPAIPEDLKYMDDKWKRLLNKTSKDGIIIRKIEILIESLAVCSTTKNPDTLKNRFDTCYKTIQDLLYEENNPDYNKYAEFVINMYRKGYSLPINDEVAHIVRNPFQFIDMTLLEDIFYWSNLSRCYKEMYYEELNKLKDLKTNKGKINRLEKLNEMIQQGINELSFAGSSHPNYYDLFEFQNNIQEEIQTLESMKPI